MANQPPPEFWKKQFVLGGNSPGIWFQSAFNLLTAADVLDRFEGDLRGEILEEMSSDPSHEKKMTRHRVERESVASVIAMLRAMATECLLKALWLKHGGTLTKDGRYVGVLKKNEHHLHELAKMVSQKSCIEFSKHELDLLERASEWIVSGRYPIQKHSASLVKLMSHPPWQGDPREELKRLIAKLQAALGVEVKFESE